jgi:ComF family protein
VKSLLAALFPSDCRICQASLFTLSRLPVCPSCVESIQPIQFARCNVCGDLLPTAEAALGDARCGGCAAEGPAFERAVNYGAYTGVLRQLIHLLKYERIRAAALPLARLTAAACLQLEGDIDVEELLMIPVPVHKLRMRSRGFNQAELIARAALGEIEDAIGRRLTLDATALLRVRFAESQVGLTLEERRQQIRGAFKVIARERVKGREILLVDDVLTTGATASECARELLQAGAARVWVVTPARALSREIVRDGQIELGSIRSAIETASLPATSPAALLATSPATPFSNRSLRPSLPGSSFASSQADAAQANLRPRRGTSSHGGYRVGSRAVAPARSEDYANGQS